MKFGFIVHPRSVKELRRSLPPYGFPYYPLGTDEFLKSKCLKNGIIKEFFTFKNILSADSKCCSGKIFCIYLSPDQFVDNQSLVLELMEKASDYLKNWGSEVIGLGGLTGVVGSRGKELQEKISMPVTSGNSFTVYSSIKMLERIARELNIDLRKEKVTVIGFPGSISLAVAQILVKKGTNLMLVSKRETPYLKQFLAKVKNMSCADIKTTSNIEDSLKGTKIVLSATSTGQIIDPDKLNKGTIVIDIAQPRDVIKKRIERDDILIVDGGIVTLPHNNKKKYKVFGWDTNDVPGCLGETIILALENRRESFSIGRNLSIEKIEEIGKLGEKHGFVTDNLRRLKKPIKEKQIQKFAQIYSNN